MTEKKQQQYEDENGYYVWRTVHGHPVKIYKEKSIYESIVMSNLQKSMQKELDAAKERNARHIADKITKIFKTSNHFHIQTANIDLINKGVDHIAEMNKKYPLKCLKPREFDIMLTKYLGYVTYSWDNFEAQDMVISKTKYSKSEKEIIDESAWAHEWHIMTHHYDKTTDSFIDCPYPTNKMDCKKEDVPIYTFIHEYGHLLEHDIVIERCRKDDPNFGRLGKDAYETEKKVKSLCRKIKNEILKIYKKDKSLEEEFGQVYDYEHYISIYGTTNPSEFFAELFVGSYLAQDNDFGNNNRLIRAFRIWLEKERGK